MANKPEAVASLQILKSNIKQKETARMYFFYGEEKLLQDQALKALGKQILPEGLEDFNKDIKYYYYDSETVQKGCGKESVDGNSGSSFQD